MKVLITGIGGLVGSEAARAFLDRGAEVIGIENDFRSQFFGTAASVAPNLRMLMADFPSVRVETLDIRDRDRVSDLFRELGSELEVVIHAAAQPSHDWAASNPHLDFEVNAVGTLNLLEGYRLHSPEATFLFMSTNKVYGDLPNFLPFVEEKTRWNLPRGHEFSFGISESMAIDKTTHSLFGVSKASADLMVQEYGRYFKLRTAVFRAGCITGGAHAGAKLHGFLAFLVKSVVLGQEYTVIGHKGKQVRDNIHAGDLARALGATVEDQSVPLYGAVFNIGGGRERAISPLEALSFLEDRGYKPVMRMEPLERKGDHVWWITDNSKFSDHFPNWSQRYSLEMILDELISNSERDKSAAT